MGSDPTLAEVSVKTRSDIVGLWIRVLMGIFEVLLMKGSTTEPPIAV